MPFGIPGEPDVVLWPLELQVQLHLIAWVDRDRRRREKPGRHFGPTVTLNVVALAGLG